MIRRLVAAAFLLSLHTSIAMAHDVKLEGSEWGFVGDEGPRARFVSFAGEGRIFGFGGCNRFSGEYLQSGNKVMIKPLASTRMACDEAAMQKEQALFELLGKVGQVHVDHTMLMLLDASGEQLTTLMRRGAE